MLLLRGVLYDTSTAVLALNLDNFWFSLFDGPRATRPVPELPILAPTWGLITAMIARVSQQCDLRSLEALPSSTTVDKSQVQRPETS